ncbi:MAG: Ligand-binding SRPBCC domain protein family, partial [uncultured Acidimicrobiales bacterium]
EHQHPPDRDHRRLRAPPRADHPGVRRPAREGLPGPHRPRSRRPVARAPQPRDAHRPLRLPHRRLVPLPARQRRQRVRVPRLLPRGATLGAHRPDVHLRGHAGQRVPGAPRPRGSRRRPHPADGHVPGRLLRGPRCLCRQRHGARGPGGLRAPRRAARRL